MAPKRKRTLKGSWSQLPVDVLDNIIKRLDLPVDVVSFSSVCKPWRHVALGMHMRLNCKLRMHHFVPWRSPLPMLLHPGCEGSDTHALYSLNEQKVHDRFQLQELSNKWIVGSGAGWLVTVDTVDPEVNLLNPFTGKKVPLPHSSTLPPCDIRSDNDDLSDCCYIRKVVVGSYRGSFLAVAIVATWQTIRFCRVGDLKWKKLENSPLAVDDIIFHNGKLYAVNTWTGLFEIDIIADTAKATMAAITCYRPLGLKCFLADLSGELVLLSRWMERSQEKRNATMISRIRRLRRRRDRTMTSRIGRLRRKTDDSVTSGFTVYKLVEDANGYFESYKSETGMQYPNKVGHSWVPLENLDHHMVFIGFNESISLDSRIFPRCKGNCIYFADRRQESDDILRMRGMSKIYHDVGIYHMEHQEVEYLENFCCESSPMNMVWLSPNFSSEFAMQTVQW